ncbi:MAG: hypothetical protein K2G44_02790 [Clostridia bacterium]|nr:hypothetical protein [Clostridia bacterium]
MKKIFAVFAIMFFAIACFAGCGNNDNPDSGNGSGNNGGNEESGKYSKILTEVLNSDYYNDLIDDASYSNLGYKYEDIPFTFLEKQGYDITAIKNNYINVGSCSYVYDTNKNELFLRTIITNSNNGSDYYTMYLLKYSLTDKEYEDLEMLNRGNYIQAGFFIQELDKQKSAQVVANYTLKKNIYNEMLDNFGITENTKSLFGNDGADSFIIKSVSDAKEYEEYKQYEGALIMNLDFISASKIKSSFSERKLVNIDIFIYGKMVNTTFESELSTAIYSAISTSEPVAITYFTPSVLYTYKNSFNG